MANARVATSNLPFLLVGLSPLFRASRRSLPQSHLTLELFLASQAIETPTDISRGLGCTTKLWDETCYSYRGDCIAGMLAPKSAVASASRSTTAHQAIFERSFVTEYSLIMVRWLTQRFLPTRRPVLAQVAVSLLRYPSRIANRLKHTLPRICNPSSKVRL